MKDFPQIVNKIFSKWIEDGNSIELLVENFESKVVYDFSKLTKEERENLATNLEKLSN